MAQTSALTIKTNPLMNMFLKREPTQPLPFKKPVKKVKTDNEKLNDPLNHILSWRDDIEPTPEPLPNSFRTYQQSKLVEGNPQRWGTNLQGILINIDWNTTSMEEFKQLTLTNGLLSNGMAFIWGTKTNIAELMDHFGSMGYVYAQNFTFVMLSRSKTPAKIQKQLAGNKSLLNFFSKEKSNESSVSATGKLSIVSDNDYQIGRVSDPKQIFVNQQSEYFSQTQKVLYMFRKINKKQSLELRHQRTSDVYFTIGEGLQLDWKAKEVVYRMMETLLISANFKQNQQLKLLELWAEPSHKRRGWVSVAECKSTNMNKQDTEGTLEQQ